MHPSERAYSWDEVAAKLTRQRMLPDLASEHAMLLDHSNNRTRDHDGSFGAAKKRYDRKTIRNQLILE
jgi:hypothetical protein